jgi:hypothetical protein
MPCTQGLGATVSARAFLPEGCYLAFRSNSFARRQQQRLCCQLTAHLGELSIASSEKLGGFVVGAIIVIDQSCELAYLLLQVLVRDALASGRDARRALGGSGCQLLLLAKQLKNRRVVAIQGITRHVRCSAELGRCESGVLSLQGLEGRREAARRISRRSSWLRRTRLSHGYRGLVGQSSAVQNEPLRCVRG